MHKLVVQVGYMRKENVLKCWPILGTTAICIAVYTFRLCILCNEDQIENECNFLFECDFYQHIRDVYYQGFREHCNNFDVMNHSEKLNYLMSADVVKTTAEFIYKCYCKRREFIYK